MILISHNMPHVFEVADRIHIHRLGKRIAVVTPKTHTMNEAVAIMTGAADPARRRPSSVVKQAKTRAPEKSLGIQLRLTMPERLMSEDRPIVVTGEALVDLVVASDGDLRGHPGGGPYNVARTIARLAQRVLYLGRISRDPLGDRLRRQLACDGVDLSAAVATDALTTLAMAQVDSAGVARYRFYERETSARGLTVEEARAALPARIGTLYLGTLGLVLGTARDDARDHCQRRRRRHARRPRSELPAGNDRRSRGVPRPVGRLLSRADVVKVSEEDLGWLGPGIEPVEAARRLLVDDDTIALVTLGRAGACVVTRRDALR